MAKAGKDKKVGRKREQEASKLRTFHGLSWTLCLALVQRTEGTCVCIHACHYDHNHPHHHCTGSKLCIKSSVSYDSIMSMFDSTVGTMSVHVDIWAITNWLLMYRLCVPSKGCSKVCLETCLLADVPLTIDWLSQ